MSKPRRTSRRNFIKTAAATGFGFAFAPQLGRAQSAQKSAANTQSPPPEPETKPDEPKEPQFPDLRIAFIGVGGIGGQHLNETAPFGVSCPCYCDVDTARMEHGAKRFPKAKAYQDYRQMFDKEHKNFDAVMIGTPDHHHYPATMIAMQLGKHVYTQKPLTHTPWEARQLLKAAKRYKVVTQMGNQGHAGEGWRLVYEFVHSGALGDITEVHTWTDRPIWPQGIGRPEEVDAVPATLDWDVWLGPAPQRPFKNGAYHPFSWRGWWDFGVGALGDMACHTMDGVFWALDPGHATSVEPVASTPVNNETLPNASIIKWTFPATSKRPGFAAYWYDGSLHPGAPIDLELGRQMPNTGNLFVGTKASLLVSGDYGNSPRIIPESKMREVGKPPKMLERSPGHFKEWILACAGEKPIDYPKSNFAYSAPMTESILVGNIALRLGRRLEWNGEKMEFTNVPDANQYVTKDYRPGWKF